MQSRNPHECVISHGLSLGAFHAANMVFRYPHFFKKLVAFSGRYDLTLNVDCFNDLFDGFIMRIFISIPPAIFCLIWIVSWRLSKLREMDITLVIGKEDPFCRIMNN